MDSKSSFKNLITDLPRNIFSGFVVSLIALPLGLGLAIASGAPPMAGIVSAIVGGSVVALIGGSNLTITGPGNGLVIVVLSAILTLGEGDNYEGYLFTLAAIIISGSSKIKSESYARSFVEQHSFSEKISMLGPVEAPRCCF